jgi:hypothetical protein
MRFLYRIRFYVKMFYALCIFAVGLATRHPFAHWLGMIIGLIGFGLNLYAQIRKASDEPYPPEIPNQRAVTRALFRTLAIACFFGEAISCVSVRAQNEPMTCPVSSDHS